jgi:predicted RNA-binding Zn ribbon-like protein
MADFVRKLETLEVVGGALCLDFVNTVNSRVDMEHDYLIQYSDVVGWANKIGILSPTQSNRLKKRANQNVKGAASSLSAARTLRDLLYRLFSQAAKGSEPDKKDMEILVPFYGEAISRSQLIKTGSHYGTVWNVDRSFDDLLWPIIHSAGQLLLSDEFGRVKECPGCGWLFLDTSKNQSRRWCSMNSCGARDKMRRYHKKQRMK